MVAELNKSSPTTASQRRGVSHYTRFDVILVAFGTVGLWQLLNMFAGDVAISSPIGTARRSFELLAAPHFWPHVFETIRALAAAYAIASLGGTALGAILGSCRTSGLVFEPILVALYSLPKVTLYPVILVTFGLGLSAKVAFGALHGLIPIAIVTLNAVRNIRPVLIKTARTMALSPWASIITVFIPAVSAEIIAAQRLGFSLTLLGVLIGEMFASQRGLGFLIMNAIELHDVSTMMAVSLMVALAAVAANLALLGLSRRLGVGMSEYA
jgi:NitT/TauT family transport system permease protein